ncbi:21256_t:CDS:1, partial [Cetraspora pellucida]
MLFAHGTPSNKRQFRELVTRHFRTISVQTYDLFLKYGLDQIYHMKNLILGDIQRLIAPEFSQLIEGISWNSRINEGE